LSPTPDELRAHYYQADREQWRFALCLWAAGVVLFLIVDLLLFGTASSVFPLAIPRLILVALSLLLWQQLPRIRRPAVAEGWMLAWVVVVCAQALAHEMIRPRDYFGHYPFQVLAALVFFAAVPIDWIKQTLVMGVYFALSMLLLFFYKHPPTPEYTSSVTLLLLGTLACGMLVSQRMQRYRRTALGALLALEQQAQTDALTGIANRRAFMTMIALAVARHKRSGRPLHVLMLDLDRFKAVNDQFGHDAGDQVLRAFAERINLVSLDYDCFARLGGEEFCISIAERPLDEVLQIAERLRIAIAEEPFVVREVPHVLTVSIGVAGWRSGEAGIDATMRRADGALYRAKELGRNRVEVTR